MTVIELPDDVAAALEAAAAERGVSVPDYLLALLAPSSRDGLADFIGVGSSGRTALTNVAAERAAEASHCAVGNV